MKPGVDHRQARLAVSVLLGAFIRATQLDEEVAGLQPPCHMPYCTVLWAIRNLKFSGRQQQPRLEGNNILLAGRLPVPLFEHSSVLLST